MDDLTQKVYDFSVANNPRTILLTGASTGLGLAIAKTLINETQDRIILTARKDSLHRFAKEHIFESDRVLIRPLDLFNTEEIEQVSSELLGVCGTIDIIINNAGISYRTVVEQMTPNDEFKQMQINYLGAFHLIRQFLPSMRRKQRGHVVNVSSVGGMMAMPTMASYSASKFALEGASEALWYEMKPWNISVTLVQIGFIHSNSFRKVMMSVDGRSAAENFNDPYHSHYQGMAPFVEKLMERTISTPERISKKILRVINMKRPPLRISGTLDATIFVIMRRFIPRALYHRILYFNLPNIRHWGPKQK